MRRFLSRSSPEKKSLRRTSAGIARTGAPPVPIRGRSSNSTTRAPVHSSLRTACFWTAARSNFTAPRSTMPATSPSKMPRTSISTKRRCERKNSPAGAGL